MRTAHALAVRGDDCYETPEVATEALLRAEKPHDHMGASLRPWCNRTGSP